MDRMHNLITDPIITLRLANETVSASLPRTFELLFEDAVLDFPALRPHQGPAWHAFLVQLAFLATEDGEVPTDAEGWAAALRGLTREWPKDEPWCLVAPAEAPAFLQSPAPGGDLRPYGTRIATPDELDPLVTSKNHDLKAARMRAATPEEWVFALVNLQTTEGYIGAGKYGIMRMNGAYGSRPFLGIHPLGGPGARFRRDLAVLRRRRDALFARAQGFATGRDVRLLWLEPWDGLRSLPISDLHPLVIEICRRVRLVTLPDGALEARGTGTAAPRVAARELRGVTGDPWAPVESGKDGAKVLSISADGFGWRRMKALLLSEPGAERAFERPLLAKAVTEDGEAAEIIAAALARGEGKTEGFHLRRVPITNRFAVRALADEGEERQRLARLSEDFAIHAMTAADRCLEPALFILFRKGETQKEKKKDFYKRKNTKEQVGPWMQRFDRLIDQAFFDRLWTGAESEEAARQALDAWDRWLHQAAFQVFDLAVEAAPRTDQRRIFAAARARDLLSGALRSHLPLSTTTPDQEAADAE
jgi:CRISPR system Cascade subunit CasA